MMRKFKIDIDKLIEGKLLAHERDIAYKEYKLEEYIGLKTEKEIKALERLLRFSKTLKLVAIELYPVHTIENAKHPILPHATGDWDFYGSNWGLDESVYVSSPSSMYVGTSGDMPLCKYPDTYPIGEGRIVTYVRSDNALFYFGFVFRDQSGAGSNDAYPPPDGAIYPRNGYYSRYNKGSAGRELYVAVRQGGSVQESHYGTPNPLLSANTWYHIRITWFKVGSVLQVNFEIEQSGAWQNWIEPLQFTTVLWDGSSTNRVGLTLRAESGKSTKVWVDDTEIWKSAYA